MRYTATLNLKTVRQALAAQRSGLRNLQPAFRAALPTWYRWVGEEFRDQGKPDKWAPLKASTLRRRRKGGVSLRSRGDKEGVGSAKILQDTGILRNSLTGPGPMSILRITANTMTVGTKLRYAGFHEDGTSRMPARKALVVNDQVKTDMQEAMLRDINRRAGL